MIFYLESLKRSHTNVRKIYVYHILHNSVQNAVLFSSLETHINEVLLYNHVNITYFTIIFANRKKSDGESSITFESHLTREPQ